MNNAVHVVGWPEARRFISLMRNCIRMKLDEMQEGVMLRSESRQTPAHGEEMEDEMADKPVEKVLEPSARERTSRKPAARRTRPGTRAVARRQKLRDQRRFVRLVTDLRIDMNRHGKKANNGENEKRVDVEMANT